MRTSLITLLLLAGLGIRAENPQDHFQQAAKAYDAGQFEVAATDYEQLIQAGWVSPAVYFNAGNAAFRKNDLGTAVLNYRRAWSLAPRDSEIGANLRFALQRAGVAGPLLTPWEAAFSRLSLSEWVTLTVASYWLAAAIWAWWLLRGRPVAGKRLALSLSLASLLGLMGIGFWLDWKARPEWVVTAPRQQALFAPLEGGTPHFALPEGSIVRLREESGDWLRVRAGKDEGWVRRAACHRVRP